MKSPAPASTAQRRLAFIAALLAPALVACGFGAQTDQIYQAAQGVDDRSTPVKILNAAIVASQDGSGTFAGTLVNDSATLQTLSQVTAVGATATQVSEVTLTPQGLLNLGDAVTNAEGESVAQLVLSGSSIKIGRYIQVIFEFSDAGRAVVNVPVLSSDGALGNEFTNVPLPPGSEPIPVTEPTEVHEDGEEH